MNTQEASTVDTLTMGERAYLGRLEQTIENGLQTYIDVGSALEEIRARKLYRGAHATFEDYCRDRWKISRIHAHRLIQAAELAANLLPMGNIPPDNERQARALIDHVYNDLGGVLPATGRAPEVSPVSSMVV